MPSGVATSEMAMLFTDIEGSTRRLASVGEDAYGHLLTIHHACIRAAIQAEGGVEQGTEGDAFFVTFADAASSLRAALDAQRRLREADWPDGEPLRVRMGLHLGPVAQAGGNLIGMAIHEAARIGATSHGGQVVISDHLAAATGDQPPGVRLVSLGRYELKDVERPVELLQASDGGETAFPPLRAARTGVTGAPVPATPLIGRHDEVAAVVELLGRGGSVVSIVGPPGVGKTRVAIEAAARWCAQHAGGATFVDLASCEGGADVGGRVAAAIDATPLGNETIIDALSRRLSGSGGLVVLDCCEHVIDDVASMVADVTARCGTERVLLTSREALRIDAERVVGLGPLLDATALFAQRAGGGEAASDPTVREICERLDHLPLAVELAAALTRTMGLTEIAARLATLTTFARGGRDQPERHRTLAAAIEWSERLLGEEARVALRRLSVLPAAFDLDAGAAVAETSEQVVLDLVDRSLVQRDGDRYRLLQTIRAHSLAALTAAGEIDRARGAMAAWVVASVADVEPFFVTSLDRLGEATRVRRDADLYMGAVEWLAEHDPPLALATALRLEPLWSTSMRDQRECSALLERLVDRARDAPATHRALGCNMLADSYRTHGQLDDACRVAQRAIELVGTGREGARVSSRLILGQVYALQGELDRATPLFEAALADGADDPFEVAMAARELANVATERGDAATARTWLARARDTVTSSAPLAWMVTLLEGDEARAAMIAGELELAEQIMDGALAAAQSIGVPRAISNATFTRARIARLRGDDEVAGPLLAESFRIMRSAGDVGGIAHLLVERGLRSSAAGDHERALALLQAADGIRRQVGIATPGSETAWIADALAAAIAAGARPPNAIVPTEVTTMGASLLEDDLRSGGHIV